ESLAHFERLQALLRAQNLPFRINPRLVRGLDYYNLTVFEWVADVVGTALTLCGGGRYDPLVEMLGGKPATACGFAVGCGLVRGLDYYNLTVFEWVADVGGTALTICGGGRYDPLVEMLGGKPAPACGFAMGVERVLELMRAQGGDPAQAQCDVYVVHHGDTT